MKRPPRKKYTEEEDFYLRRYYRQRGAQATRDLLAKAGFERSKHSITDRARRIGLYVEPGGKRKMVPLVEAHYKQITSNDTKHAHFRIVEAARRDGVLERSLVYPHAHLAPEWWVDQYVAMLAAEEEAYEEIDRTWLSTAEVAELFRSSPNVIATMATPKRTCRPGPLLEAVRRIPTLRLVAKKARNISVTRYWHPTVAPEQARWYLALPRRRNGGRKLSSNRVTYGGTAS